LTAGSAKKSGGKCRQFRVFVRWQVSGLVVPEQFFQRGFDFAFFQLICCDLKGLAGGWR
jgi:hypothetical protein